MAPRGVNQVIVTDALKKVDAKGLSLQDWC